MGWMYVKFHYARVCIKSALLVLLIHSFFPKTNPSFNKSERTRQKMELKLAEVVLFIIHAFILSLTMKLDTFVKLKCVSIVQDSLLTFS
jgi:hypothetical protein